MGERFFIADTHFGHRNIILFEQEKRPFATIEEHDEALIERWNRIVTPKDIVYHLGDFSLGKAPIRNYGMRLHGDKRLIMGNHDIHPAELYLANGFKKLYGALQFDRLILTHIPIHPMDLENRFWANIHGHTHSRTVPDARYVCVSVEHTELCPIPYEEVIRRVEAGEGMITGL